MFNGGVPEQLRCIIASPSPPQPTVETVSTFPFPSFLSFDSANHLSKTILADDNQRIIPHREHHHDGIKDGDISGWICPADLHGYRTDHDDEDHHHHHHPWTRDEVLALLRLRSTVENWFSDFTWEHVSRKLMEIGFKRTARECQEKFEREEKIYFSYNNCNDQINICNSSINSKGDVRVFSELEELYHHGHHHHHEHHDDDDRANVSSEVGHSQNRRQKSLEEPRSNGKGKMGQDLKEEDEGRSGNMEKDGKSSSSSSSSSAMAMMMIMKDKKKKRKKNKKRFEMLKGLCEGFVRNMIAQQEEMHKKILEDMLKRHEENIAREEAHKKQEAETLHEELNIRAHEQALASDRNSTIIKFLTNYSSSLALPQPLNSHIMSSSSSQTPNSQNLFSLHHNDAKSQEPISVQTLRTKTQNFKPPESKENNGLGKRWPRDEVLALVEIRCSISTKINGDDHHHDDTDQQRHKDGSSSKALPFWERISMKMLEFGYHRSAKRCKEKWENINKYFRKTKYANKKRTLDSRTCPYFHQLSALYGQGSLAGKVDSGKDPTTRSVKSPFGSMGDDSNIHVVANGEDN